MGRAMLNTYNNIEVLSILKPHEGIRAGAGGIIKSQYFYTCLSADRFNLLHFTVSKALKMPSTIDTHCKRAPEGCFLTY